MKKNILLFFAMMAMGLNASAQSFDLTFTAVTNLVFTQLDSIKVINRTKGCDTVLNYPDTVLTIYYTGTPKITEADNKFYVLQNYPNPVVDQTTISLFVPEKDQVLIMVMDNLGRVILKFDRSFEKGTYAFSFTPRNGNLFLFTAIWRGISSSIKIFHTGVNSDGTSSLEYISNEPPIPKLMPKKDVLDFVFNPGDTLMYIGYINDLTSGLLDSPENSQYYTFQFATNIPCPGIPIVEYEGLLYHTIQIFSQCWLKENLNVGTMIIGSQDQTNNGIKEKYCYNNHLDSCTKYGGLYQWNELMQYDIHQGAQGLCPPGWHIPTDEEWKLLEGSADSQYKVGDLIWDLFGSRGFDAGSNLKTTTGWSSGGNGTDMLGFSCLPGGKREPPDGSFWSVGDVGELWTSTDFEYGGSCSWYRIVTSTYPGLHRVWTTVMEYGFSARCIRDE